MYVYARLTENQVHELRQFEEKKDVRVLALSEARIAPADLDPDKLDELIRLEKRMGICLVAVQ